MRLYEVICFHMWRFSREIRRERRYIHLQQDKDAILIGKLASFTIGNNVHVALDNVGPDRSQSPSRNTLFWNHLQEHEGEWMWEGVKEEYQDIFWLVLGIKNKTVVCVTDESYNRK